MQKRKRHNTRQQAFFNTVEKVAPKERDEFHRSSTGEKLHSMRTVKLRHKPVAWGIPLDEVLFGKFFTNWLRLPYMPWDATITTSSTYLPEARNNIHADFLSTGLEWLVMLDSDVLPPPDFLSRLLAHDLPFVGGWYRKKSDPYPPVVYDFDHQGDDGIYHYRIREQPGKGLEKVDAAGAGCWLMHRKVAVAIGEKPYNMERGGEDLELCRKVHAAGFDIHIDWSIACAHAGVGLA